MDKSRQPKPESEWIAVDIGAQIGAALFSEEEIREVRYRMSLRRKRRTNSKESLFVPDDFLLQGLVQCGICGGKLSIHAMKPDGTKVYRYYKCHNRDKGNCTFKYVHAEVLDRNVLIEFFKTFKEADRLKEAIVEEEFLPESKRRDLEALVKKSSQDFRDIIGKQDRLSELYMEGDIKKDTYQAKRDEYELAKFEALVNVRKARQTLARPDDLLKAMEQSAQEMARMFQAIVRLAPRFNKWARAELEAHIMDISQQPDEIKKLILRQMSGMLGRFVISVKVWKEDKFKIFGSLPDVNGKEDDPSSPATLSPDNIINSSVESIRVK
jgi:hypothetical protein